MELIKITDLTDRLGLSSRSLRYYEQVGLIRSVRPPFQKYRFYEHETVERLQQIIVLRKMQIPVKDIIRIYESQDMSVVVETFVHRIHEIDQEIGALAELKRIVGEFLKTMMQNGVSKISALPLLYEEMNKQLDLMEERKPVTADELNTVSETLAKPVDITIVDLPPMRVISSSFKANPLAMDAEGFSRFLQAGGLGFGAPGSHERFEFQSDAGDCVMVRVPDDFINESDYLDYRFNGGLFAAVHVYLDEDLDERFRSLVKQFDGNNYYQIEYAHDGTLRHPALIENVISPDDQRELVSLLVPVKKRLANPALFAKPEEIATDKITVEEIEAQNPILWSQDAAMDKLIPINSPTYNVTEQGEAEYVSWISTRVLSTGIAVKLPFRVDIVFRIGEETGGWGHGKNEKSLRLYHGEDLNYLFGVNMENDPDERLSKEAICFHQPVFGDYFTYPKRGGTPSDIYNRLTWIVGMKHFAVIINGEIRYCGVNFPYMAIEADRQQARPILVGTNSSIKRYFRSIRVSQLAQPPKMKIKKGTLTMITRQSNNIIPNIHRFITSEHGENYWFNGCARYVMESLGEYKDEPDFGYWFFAGLTGDILAQVYSYKDYMGEAVSACAFHREGGGYFEKIFEQCGYASTFVSAKQLAANKEMYLQTLMAYIDKGVPVIAITHLGPAWGIYVGYEEFGKTLLFLTGDKVEPIRVPTEQVIGEEAAAYDSRTADGWVASHAAKGWIFVGEKKRTIDIAQVYRDIIINMPKLLTTKTKDYCFGAEAFRAWADGIENGKYDDVKPEKFDAWDAHVSNICNMATNGSCVHGFLERARELTPDFIFLSELHPLYKRTADIWNNDNGQDLEALGGGFNVTLEALQNKDKRAKIAAKLREAATCMDEVVRIVKAGVGR